MSSGPSYDVRVWELRPYRGKRRTTYTARWTVGQRHHQKTFPTRKLADAFRSSLVAATHSGIGFLQTSGLPRSMAPSASSVTWVEHARKFVDLKWPTSSPRHRKSLAEALTTVTTALTTTTSNQPESLAIRRALMAWTFNLAARAAAQDEPPAELAPTLRWLEARSLTLSELERPATARLALNAISVKLDGRPASPATVRRKRSALYSALEYAVELELLTANPLSRLTWQRPPQSEAVDQRVVVNPDQARGLLAAVAEQRPELEAFFACIYYAAMRPSEVRHLRVADLDLPNQGWGRLTLTGSTQASGPLWTDNQATNEDRALKHRPPKEVRSIPASPELIATLRRHIDCYPPGIGGRLFVARTTRAGVPLAGPYGSPVSMNMLYRAWSDARAAALTPDQYDAPLARRPYDLRHAAVSLWLNSGVPPTQVAAWAGHSVTVLLRVYAACIDGQEALATSRIEIGLRASQPEETSQTSPRIPRGQP
jgi:integrase